MNNGHLESLARLSTFPDFSGLTGLLDEEERALLGQMENLPTDAVQEAALLVDRFKELRRLRRVITNSVSLAHRKSKNAP